MSDYREVDDNEITGGSDNSGANASGDSKTGNTQNSSKAENSKYDSDEYEKVCYICRRTESKAGKMISMPGNIYVCTDCMQKTLDSINGSGMSYDDMLKNMNIPNMPNIPKMPNMNNFNGMMFGDFMDNYGTPDRQKVKKKKEKSEPVIDLKSIPAPHHIKEKLDEFVVGQDKAKKVLSVAVYNHYKRVAENVDDVEIEKSNILMIGPTGSGKTYLVKTLARILQVPLAIADATSLTEAGYIGDDIESVVSKLLAAADNDVEKAEHGIIFVDEIDKIAKKKETRSRDVSGESVQQGMLKLLEGSNVEVPVGANSKNAMVPLVTVNTKNILFICGGAFPGLDDIIKERLNKQSSIGFNADLKDKYDEDKNLCDKVTMEDLRNFGMIPEFLGRLPVVCSLQRLTKEMLVSILKEPKNAILKQYKKLLAMDEVNLEFDDDALGIIAEKAMEKDTGARALRSILEEYMLDIMYEIPKDGNIGKVTITADYINGKGAPRIEMRGLEVPLIGSAGA
ncbi:MAG: ATP-dependent Clp protease ATP-binding subunit ClpX [Clostridia bacterium]|nr:ATP-dependent Clp protease ATP-binding subunit ClpX [Clostridia bacterium]